MQQSDLISIIIPVYNTEEYLASCLESVLAQTYENLEIILVDDGSTDSCPQICDEFAARDTRVCVIHTENNMAAAARNTGIDASTGEYIMLVDSDDRIHPDMIRIMLGVSKKHDADIVASDHQRVSVPDYNISTDISTFNLLHMSNKEAIEFYLGFGRGGAWAKLYKSSLFKTYGVRFPSGNLCDDSTVDYKLNFYANHVIYLDCKLYFYLQQHGSQSHSRPLSNKFLEDYFICLKDQYNFFKENELGLTRQIEARSAVALIRFLNDNLLQENCKRNHGATDMLRTLFNDNARQYLSNPHLRIYYKVGIVLLRAGLWCYIPYIKLYYTLKPHRVHNPN